MEIEMRREKYFLLIFDFCLFGEKERKKEIWKRKKIVCEESTWKPNFGNAKILLLVSILKSHFRVSASSMHNSESTQLRLTCNLVGYPPLFSYKIKTNLKNQLILYIFCYKNII